MLLCLSGIAPLQSGVTHSKVHQEKDMPNIATVLKEEIVRLARREIRKQTGVLKKASAQYRKDIAEMKRRIADLRRKVTPIEKQGLKNAPSQAADVDAERVRFTAKGLRSQRKRLGLSAANYGKLVGVTGQTIYSWEQETSRPRKQQLAQIASLRHLGKREALAYLEQMAGRNRKRSK
jgi:DNA-binding transcriptional regulator YiaG